MAMGIANALPVVTPGVAPASAPVSAPEGDSGGGEFDEAAARSKAIEVLEGKKEPEAAVAEEKKPEPKPEPEKKTEDGSEDDLTKEWIRFRNQDKRLKERAREFSDEKGAFATEKETFAKEQSEFRATQERAKKEPLAALQALGWSFEDLVNYVGKNGQIPQEKLLNDLKLQNNEELKKIRDEIEASKKAQAEQEKQATISKYETLVEQEVRTSLAQYPHLQAIAEGEGFNEEVLPGVFKFLHQNALSGKYLPPSAAMQYYEQRLSMMAARLPGRTSPAPGGSVKSEQPEAAKPSNGHSSLTNDDVSERASTVAPDDEDLPTLRRRAKALLAG